MSSYAAHWPDKGLRSHEDEAHFERDTVRSNGVSYYGRHGDSMRYSPHERDIQSSGVTNAHFRGSRLKGSQPLNHHGHEHPPHGHGNAQNGYMEDYNLHHGRRGESHHPEDSHHGGQFSNHLDGIDPRFQHHRADYAHGQRGPLLHGMDDNRPQAYQFRQEGARSRGYESPLGSWSPGDSSPRSHHQHLPRGSSSRAMASSSPQEPERRFPPPEFDHATSRYHMSRGTPLGEPHRNVRKDPLLSHQPSQRAYPPSMHAGYGPEEEKRRYRGEANLPPPHPAEKSATKQDPRLLRNKSLHSQSSHQQQQQHSKHQDGKSRVEVNLPLERLKFEHCYPSFDWNGLVAVPANPPKSQPQSNATESKDESNRAIVPRCFLSPVAADKRSPSGILRSSNKTKPATSSENSLVVSPQATDSATKTLEVTKKSRPHVHSTASSSYIHEFKFPLGPPSISLHGFELDLDLEPESSGDEEFMSEEESEKEEKENKVKNQSRKETNNGEQLLVSVQRKEEQHWTLQRPSPDLNKFIFKLHVPALIVPKKPNQPLPTATTEQRLPEILPLTSEDRSSAILLTKAATAPTSAPRDETKSADSNAEGTQPTMRRSKRLATMKMELNASESEEEEGDQVGGRDRLLFQMITLSDDGEDFDLVGKENGSGSEGRKRRTRSTRSSRSKRARNDHTEELAGQSKRKAQFADFVPEILPARSRTESATIQRRNEMEKEIEQHERERLQTARPEEINRPVSPLDTMFGVHQSDDLESEQSISISYMTVSSQERDSGSTRSIIDDFSPDIVAQCKKMATRNFSGDTPLHKVCRSGKYELVRYLLLVENAPVNVQDNAGWAPLHEACSSLHIDIVQLLLQNGADVNISATDGTRPIHDAIERGSLELVKLLIEHGADPQAEFGEKTPVEYAKIHDQKEIHDYLQSVVLERQKQRSRSVPSVPVLSHKRAFSLRGNKKQKTTSESREELAHVPTIPVCGYTQDDPTVCPELDFPLFYVTPIVELSEVPFLPVYNIEIVPGENPRRHNFYILTDLLDAFDKMSESQLIGYLTENGIKVWELTVQEFYSNNNFKHPYYNRQVPKPKWGKGNPTTKKLKLVPLCKPVQELLEVQVENLDD